MVTRATALEHTRSESGTRTIPLAIAAALLLAGGALAPAAAEADPAWVRGGLRLNLRTEPGTQYRILGVLETGDAVELLRLREDWTKVRAPDGKEGWIPTGYLRPDPPPELRLEQVQAELTSLRAKAEKSGSALRELESRNEELSARDAEQRERIEELIAENSEMRQRRRWPEWITGAAVLLAGMLLGGILHRNATRRASPRIRL